MAFNMVCARPCTPLGPGGVMGSLGSSVGRLAVPFSGRSRNRLGGSTLRFQDKCCTLRFVPQSLQVVWCCYPGCSSNIYNGKLRMTTSSSTLMYKPLYQARESSRLGSRYTATSICLFVYT